MVRRRNLIVRIFPNRPCKATMVVLLLLCANGLVQVVLAREGGQDLSVGEILPPDNFEVRAVILQVLADGRGRQQDIIAREAHHYGAVDFLGV